MSEFAAGLHKSTPGVTRAIKLFTTGAAPGEFEIAPLAAGKKLRVIAAVISCSTGNAFEVKSGTSTVLMHGLINGTIQTSLQLQYNPVGWFETAAGENLRINQTTSVAGNWASHVVYVEVD